MKSYKTNLSGFLSQKEKDSQRRERERFEQEKKKLEAEQELFKRKMQLQHEEELIKRDEAEKKWLAMQKKAEEDRLMKELEESEAAIQLKRDSLA